MMVMANFMKKKGATSVGRLGAEKKTAKRILSPTGITKVSQVSGGCTFSLAELRVDRVAASARVWEAGRGGVQESSSG